MSDEREPCPKCGKRHYRRLCLSHRQVPYSEGLKAIQGKAKDEALRKARAIAEAIEAKE